MKTPAQIKTAPAMNYRRTVLMACLLAAVALSAAALASEPCSSYFSEYTEGDTLVSNTRGHCGGTNYIKVTKRPIPAADTSVAADDSASVVINDTIVTTVRRGPVTTITEVPVAETDTSSLVSIWVPGSPVWLKDTLVIMSWQYPDVITTRKILMPRIKWRKAADDSASVVIGDTLVTTTRRGASVTVKKVPIADIKRANPDPLPPAERSWKSGETTVALSPDGTLRVSGKGAMGAGYFSGRPWLKFAITGVIIEEGVTRIEEYAFAGLSGLKSVTIPNSVTSIGAGAFRGCTGLASVTIPGSVASIGSGAFAECAGLMSIAAAADNPHYSSAGGILFNRNRTAIMLYPPGRQGAYAVPGSVKGIGKGAFAGSALTSVTIPKSVTEIGDYAFAQCEKLASVTIPNSVKSIGDYAFWESDALKSVTIPNGVTSIGNYAFKMCGALESITIPNSVTEIGNGVFYRCRSLKSVSIPNSVRSIGQNAFSYCNSLKSISIPDSVRSIGQYAFSGCYNLASVTLHEGIAIIGAGVFSYCEDLTDMDIPKSVVAIGTGAFDGTGLTEDHKARIDRLRAAVSVTIPKGVTVIAGGAFKDYENLKSVTIPEGVVTIGNSAFESCTSLVSVIIPGSVRRIEGRAFIHCANLTGVTLPANLTHLESLSFSSCESLTSVTVLNPNPPSLAADKSNFWSGIKPEAKLFVPKGSIEAYRAAEGWKEFKYIQGLESAPKGE